MRIDLIFVLVILFYLFSSYLIVQLNLFSLLPFVLIFPMLSYLYVAHIKNLEKKALSNFIKAREKDNLAVSSTKILLCVYSFLLFGVFSFIGTTSFFLDQVVFFFFVVYILLGKGKKFINDWVWLIIPILAFSAMRGIADNLSQYVHYQELIDADKAIFGFLPTVELQNILYNPLEVGVHDVIFILVYLMHYWMPVFLAYIFWDRGDSIRFKRLSTALVIASYIGLITFILYPAAPPWLASKNGFVSDIDKIMEHTFEEKNLQIFGFIYLFFNVNEVAAMPSLHSTYAWLFAFFCIDRWGMKGFLSFFFPMLLSLGLVYTGEHYVIDIIAGIILAVIVFLYSKYFIK